jgi:hypothetical protein
VWRLNLRKNLGFKTPLGEIGKKNETKPGPTKVLMAEYLWRCGGYAAKAVCRAGKRKKKKKEGD